MESRCVKAYSLDYSCFLCCELRHTTPWNVNNELLSILYAKAVCRSIVEMCGKREKKREKYFLYTTPPLSFSLALASKTRWNTRHHITVMGGPHNWSKMLLYSMDLARENFLFVQSVIFNLKTATSTHSTKNRVTQSESEIE